MKYRIAIAVICLTYVLIGCNPKALLESEPYDFRKARWGYTKEMVLTSEQGKRLHVKKGNLIIYNHAFGHTQAKIVYCFQDNKLTAAGYITDKPTKDVERILAQSVAKHGKPDEQRFDGFQWNLERSIVYSHAYVSNYQYRGSPQWRTGGGIIDHLYERPKERAGVIRHWDCVWAYIDRNLYDALHDERFPLDRLSFYEKMLFGVVKRSARATFSSDRIPWDWESLQDMGMDIDIEE